MTETQSTTRSDPRDTDPDGDTADRATLTSRIEQLEAENRRLRRSVEDTHRGQYRRTAVGLVAVGLVCGLVGLATTRSAVLFALAGIGLFSGVLTYTLTPDRVVAADLGTRIYAATAGSFEELCADLGLSDRRVYVPVESTRDEAAVRLFVPQQATMQIPDGSVLNAGAFIVEGSGTYGLSVQPTGGGLFAAFRTVLDGPLDSDPQAAARQLSEAVVEDFELARSVTTDADPEQGRLSVRFVDPLFECRSGFDHPLVSFFAVGLAVGLDTPVETTVTNTDPLSATLRWETDRRRADTATANDHPAAQPSPEAD